MIAPSTPSNGPLRRAILLRHGRTAWNAQRRWQGWVDVPLDSTGLAQAERAAAGMVGETSIVTVTTSPLRRAAQSANVVKGALDLAGRPVPVVTDERLCEIDMGEWAGLTHEEMIERFPGESGAIDCGEDVRRGVTGETLTEATRRVRMGFDDAVAELPGGATALLVVHGAVLRGVVADLCGIPMPVMKCSFATVDNAHWVVVSERTRGRWVVEAWNVGSSLQ